MSLLVGTRKGLLTLDRNNGSWKVTRESHTATPVPYAWQDKRTGHVWATLQHGHWGPKMSRSADGGGTWEDVATPTYPDGATIKDDKPATVLYLWMMAPADPVGKRLYAGTEPGGLFVSDDQGMNFTLVEALWKQPTRPEQWFGAAAGTSEWPAIHSVLVDPRDTKRVLVGISVGGVFETTDGGASWAPRNKGLKAYFLPDPDAEVGQDPHLMVAAPSNFDVLWQQNHCGIFRSTDGGQNWQDISEKEGPARFGFAISVHEKRPDTAWVVPAQADDCRIPVDRALCVCRTEDGGQTWTALRRGLPQEHCYDLVYRHALDLQGDVLAFGSTTGNLWVSEDGGDSWKLAAAHLPPINSVRFAAL